MTGLATILLLLVPFIPGLRDIPRLHPAAPADLARLEGDLRGRLAAPADTSGPVGTATAGKS